MDFSQYLSELQAIVDEDFNKAGFGGWQGRVLELQEGGKFIRIVAKDKRLDGSLEQYGSAFGFIVKEDNSAKSATTGQWFKAGDLLKTAGWKAPARNFSRGNITDLKNAQVRWTGVY